jgi:predicted phosphoribosyltransferase
VVLQTPYYFSAVGEWYDRFDQVSDDEVRAALAAAG